MIEPRHAHWVETKHVLRYLCGIVGYGLRYVSSDEARMQGNTNFNWEGSVIDRKSTSWCRFSMGSTMIS